MRAHTFSIFNKISYIAVLLSKTQKKCMTERLRKIRKVLGRLEVPLLLENMQYVCVRTFQAQLSVA